MIDLKEILINSNHKKETGKAPINDS